MYCKDGDKIRNGEQNPAFLGKKLQGASYEVQV